MPLELSECLVKCGFQHIITVGCNIKDFSVIDKSVTINVQDEKDSEGGQSSVKHINIYRKIDSDYTLIEILKCLWDLNFISIGMIYVHDHFWLIRPQDQQMKSIEHLMKSLVLPLSQNNFVSDDFKVILPFTAKLLFQLIVNFDKFNKGSLDFGFQGNKQREFEVKDFHGSDKL